MQIFTLHNFEMFWRKYFDLQYFQFLLNILK